MHSTTIFEDTSEIWTTTFIKKTSTIFKHLYTKWSSQKHKLKETEILKKISRKHKVQENQA